MDEDTIYEDEYVKVNRDHVDVLYDTRVRSYGVGEIMSARIHADSNSGDPSR